MTKQITIADFNVGDKVALLVNPKEFVSDEMRKFSGGIMTIKEIHPRSYCFRIKEDKGGWLWTIKHVDVEKTKALNIKSEY